MASGKEGREVDHFLVIDLACPSPCPFAARGGNVKLCTECKWFVNRVGGFSPLEECTRNPWPKRIDYVRGGYIQPQEITQPVFAQKCRESIDGCGNEARWFEPKEKANAAH